MKRMNGGRGFWVGESYVGQERCKIKGMLRICKQNNNKT